MNALLRRSAAAPPALRLALEALFAAEQLRFQAVLTPAAAPLSTSKGSARSPCGRLVEGGLGIGVCRGFHSSATPLGFRESGITGAECAVDDAPFWEDRSCGEAPDEGLEISKLAIAPEIATALAQRGITKLFPIQESRFLAHRELSALPNRITLPTTTGISVPKRHLTTDGQPEKAVIEDKSVASMNTDQPQRIKFKRLDKTARHIMNILDKEEVEKVRGSREIPDIKPGYIVQLKVEVPENKRRVSSLKGIVIARRNAGLHTTFRLRRMVAGVGVESVFPLYSPNIKEMKVLDKKDVRRAKLYYLRDRMNALKHK